MLQMLRGTKKETVVEENTNYGDSLKREQIKKERLALKAKTHDVMLQQGYIPMEEMMSISGLSYSTIYNAIKSSALADAKNVHHKWYVQRKTFVEYLHDKSPKPRRRNE